LVLLFEYDRETAIFRGFKILVPKALIYLSRFFDQETAKGPFLAFESSCHLLLPV